MKCPICNKEVGDIEETINHLEKSHFLSYLDYIENYLLAWSNDGFTTCYNCGETRTPLTWLEKDFYYLPCRDCIKRKTDLAEAKEDIIKNIKSYYKRIMSDRHFQLFILDDVYLQRTFPHDYDTFSKILKTLDLPKDRDELWFLDWKPGYPKLLTLSNLDGIELVSLTRYFRKFINEEDRIIVGDYEIKFPEWMPYDSKHKSRYNLLNKSNETRRTKRLRLSGFDKENNCIKFYSSGEDWNSIFKLYKDGIPVNLSDLDHLDTLIIKLAILRNKTCVKIIYEVIYELLKDVSYYKDSIFLKNNILLDSEKSMSLNLSWFPNLEKLNKNIINISVL